MEGLILSGLTSLECIFILIHYGMLTELQNHLKRQTHDEIGVYKECWDIQLFFFFLMQTMLASTKTALQQKIKKRMTKIEEIDMSRQSCKVSCMRVENN